MTTKGKDNAGSLSDAQLEALAAEAERGYDVNAILRRRRSGRPPLGSAAASVESVRLDSDLKRELLLRAARDHTSVSEVIRRASESICTPVDGPGVCGRWALRFDRDWAARS